MTNNKVQTRISPYINNQLHDFANRHNINVSECVRYILIRFFDDYERIIRRDCKWKKNTVRTMY